MEKICPLIISNCFHSLIDHACDRDNDRDTGSTPALLGFPSNRAGIDVVAVVHVATAGSVIESWPGLYEYSGSSFTPISDQLLSARAMPRRMVAFDGATDQRYQVVGASVEVTIPAWVLTDAHDQLPLEVMAFDGRSDLDEAFEVMHPQTARPYPYCVARPEVAGRGALVAVEGYFLPAGANTETFIAQTHLGGALADEEGSVTLSFRIPDGLSLGLHILELRVPDTGIMASCPLTVENRRPIARGGGPYAAEAAGWLTPVPVSGAASRDPDDDPLAFRWSVGHGTWFGPTPTLLLPVGSRVVILSVEDRWGLTSFDAVLVEVHDTTPPSLSLVAEPDILWPPDHRMVDITVYATAADHGGAPPEVVLLSVTSNEPDDALGDGHTTNDIQGAEPGTPDYHVRLRAERAGGGGGRIYTLTYQATDVVGNATTASVPVIVPHDHSGW